jgi:hypothetical protein
VSPRRPRAQPRVLLDTNIWRYVADAGAANELRHAAARNKVRLQVAPSTVYEALRTGDAGLRAKLLDVMTRPSWARLLPEVRDEANEFLHEVRRLRPSWINPRPDRNLVRRLQYDWVRRDGGFWDRARATPDIEAKALTILEEGMLDHARTQAEKARERSISAGMRYESVSLADLVWRPAQSLSGWDGDDIEPWRISALAVTSPVVDSPGTSHAFIQWLGNEVDFEKARADRASWNRFWLYEAELLNMPRHWLRWGFEILQSLRRVTDGTPCDAQLGTYLTQCDCFVTADKALADMTKKVHKAAVFRIGSPVVVPGDSSAMTSLLDTLDSLRHNHRPGFRDRE